MKRVLRGRNVLVVLMLTLVLTQVSFVLGQGSGGGSDIENLIDEGNPNFFSFVIDLVNSWFKGDGFSQIESKFLLFIIFFALLIALGSSLGLNNFLTVFLSFVLSFFFTAFIAPDLLVEIFKSYEPLPLTVAVMLPMLVLFGLTALAGKKANSTLIVLQFVFWLAYFIYSCVFTYVDWNPLVNESPVLSGSALTYYHWTLIINLVISFIMVLFNGHIVGWIVHAVFKGDQAAADAMLNRVKLGMGFLGSVGQNAAGGP